VICPCLTYLDMRTAMADLRDHFGLDVVWLGDEVAEIRWHGGVAVAQVDRPDQLHGTHVGHGWTYVQVDDPDTHCARSLERGARVLNAPHSTSDGLQRGYTARDREGNLWTFAVAAFGRGVPPASW
jgi:uncharacterized glyoxalase superfamily protein PhnB